TLSGASFSPIRVKTQKPSDPDRLGHFFLAIDPKVFRPEGAFEDDLDAVIDELHGTPAVDTALPGPGAAARAAGRAHGGVGAAARRDPASGLAAREAARDLRAQRRRVYPLSCAAIQSAVWSR